jgi:hypothetical protein
LEIPNVEEFQNLYSSPNIIRMMKSDMMGWAGNVARMGPRKYTYDFDGELRRKEINRKT